MHRGIQKGGGRIIRPGGGDLQYPFGYPDGKGWFELLAELAVTSVSGEPTISRAVPIKLNSSDVSIDWSGVSSKADLLVRDQDGNTLDYYFESFDADSEEAAIWVYRDWARDGSTQIQIVEGDGETDESTDASTVFDKESGLDAGYLFNETTGDLLDVTSNNHNGTLNGDVIQGKNGIVDGAYKFNGEDASIDLGSSGLTEWDDWEMSAWIRNDDLSSQNTIFGYVDEGDLGYVTVRFRTDGAITFWHRDDSDVRTWGHTDNDHGNIGTWQHIRVNYDRDADEFSVYVDDSAVDISYNDHEGPGVVVLDSNPFVGALYNADASPADERFFDGLIDNLNFFAVPKSSTERTALYDATKPSPDFFEQV